MRTSSRLLLNSVANLGNGLISTLLALVLTPVLVHYLDRHAFGVWLLAGPVTIDASFIMGSCSRRLREVLNMTVHCEKARPGVVVLGLVVTAACGPLHAAEPFDYFANSWSVIGLKDYKDGTRVTPANELLLEGKKKVRVRFGRDLTPLSRRQTKMLLEGWLPVVLISAQDGRVRYDLTLWTTPLPTVKDWQKAFDWPTEGENFLNWIAVKVTNDGPGAEQAKIRIEHLGTPTAPVTSLESHTWSLNSGQSAACVARIPFAPVQDATVLAKEDPQVWLDRTVRFWRGLMSQAARVEVPCAKATQALLAAHVCQLIANDHGELHGGEGFYDEFYIRDGGYQIMELEEAGLFDAVKKAVARYLTSQRPDGRFETQTGQFDANGQAVWVLWQYHKITGDREWLNTVYPQMRRAVDWTIKARREAPAGSPFAGVLPAAVADGEYLWDGKHHIVGYDFWNLRGMLCTADAARILGKTAEARELLAEAERYRADIDTAWKRTGLPHFPPSWEKAGTHWGNTETLWPTELFAPDDPRVTALLTEVRRHHGGGFVEGTIRWLGTQDAIHPYMSAYTTMASLVRGEHDQVVEDFYWYLLHSAATHAFPEGIYFKRRFAWSDTIPHVTGASNYALMLRHMLLHERGDDLHLLPGVPDEWLAEGKAIVVERAPTHFGPVNLYTHGQADGVRIRFDPPARQAPKRVILHLPTSRPLLEETKGVDVARRPDQKQRWDFAGVVERYLKQAPPAVRPIPAWVVLPLEPALDRNRCDMLDLTPVANTDPFTAPFGVPNPGKYLFKGMPVGDQVIGGVPFRILDPAKTQGRGLVVLHSPSAPADRSWPREVEIPVNARGKRLFFLGNVHGWGADDEGTGEWGAVAEYVIHYADGGHQEVPLITGRTADDWVSTPTAAEVFCGLQGDPWHLNVLGVSLRDVAISKVVFRDLGTRAAPLLVAVTLEK